MDGQHVKSSKRHLLQLTDTERIRAILQDIWIDCPQSTKAMRMVKNLLSGPRQLQAPCLLVCGEGGVGKTSIVRQLKTFSKVWHDQIVFMALHENPANMHFKEFLLAAMGAPSRNRGSAKPMFPEELHQWVLSQKIRAIVIDEFHDALIANRTDQLKTLSMIKALSGEPYNVSIVGFGTALARNALTLDAQLSRRFYIHEIPRWTESEPFRQFLAALEENIPLRHPSNLYSHTTVKFLLSTSNGIMDSVVKTVKFAAIRAIINGEEKVSIETMKAAIENPWDYALPQSVSKSSEAP